MEEDRIAPLPRKAEWRHRSQTRWFTQHGKKHRYLRHFHSTTCQKCCILQLQNVFGPPPQEHWYLERFETWHVQNIFKDWVFHGLLVGKTSGCPGKKWQKVKTSKTLIKGHWVEKLPNYEVLTPPHSIASLTSHNTSHHIPHITHCI